ncbi:MAG: hypothetical protein AAGJ46_02800 [Planctomycetota bacterium]
MTARTSSVAACLLAAGLVAATNAQPGGEEGNRAERGRRPGPPPPDVIFDEIDADGDGSVSREEFIRHHEERFGEGGPPRPRGEGGRPGFGPPEGGGEGFGPPPREGRGERRGPPPFAQQGGQQRGFGPPPGNRQAGQCPNCAGQDGGPTSAQNQQGGFRGGRPGPPPPPMPPQWGGQQQGGGWGPPPPPRPEDGRVRRPGPPPRGERPDETGQRPELEVDPLEDTGV